MYVGTCGKPEQTNQNRGRSIGMTRPTQTAAESQTFEPEAEACAVDPQTTEDRTPGGAVSFIILAALTFPVLMGMALVAGMSPVRSALAALLLQGPVALIVHMAVVFLRRG